MFGMSFDHNPPAGYNAPRVSYATLLQSIDQLRVADGDALTRMLDDTLSAQQRTAAVGESEALHDMLTDLGSMSVTFEQRDALEVSITLAHVLFGWSQMAKRHRTAHKEQPKEEQEDVLTQLLHALRQQQDLPCQPMHQAAATAYEKWAYHFLNQWADSLTTTAA